MDLNDAIYQALKAGVPAADISKANPDVVDVVQSQLRRVQLEAVAEGNPIAQLARSRTHILVGARTGGGKTSTILAVLADICTYYPGCLIKIVTPKDDRFFQWASVPDQRVVTYLSFPKNPLDTTWVDELYSAVERAYHLLIDRIKANQELAKQEKPAQSWSPAYLFLDEYFVLYAALQKLPKIEEEQKVNDKLKIVKVRDDRGDQIFLMLQRIVAMGRSNGVYLILSGQSANCEEIGFSGDARRNFSFVALGKYRSGDGTLVGYDSIFGALNNASLFADRAQVDRLKGQVRNVINQAKSMGDMPVALINAGEALLWIVPDLRQVSHIKIPLPNAI